MAMTLPVAPARLVLTLSVLAVVAGCSTARQSGPQVAPVTVPDTVVENRFSNTDDQDTYTAIVPRTTATTIETRTDYPSSYTVVRGDTLWDISGKFLQKPWLWPQIWDINPDIKNPHLIYPGDQIALDYSTGGPRFVVSRNDQRLEGDTSSTAIAKSRPKGTQYERRSPEIRSESLEDAIPTIPGDAIQQFLIYPQVVTLEEIESAPYIIGNGEGRLTSAAGHQIYARGNLNPNQHNYGIFRRSEELRDPVTGELLGYEVDHVANAKLQKLGDPATLQIINNKMETLSGDILMESTEQDIVHSYIPRMPKMKGEGRIISLINAIAQSGRNQVVVLNIGARAGIEVGDVMAIERRGGTITDRFRKRGNQEVNLPSTRTGVLMVFQTFDKVSYALVMESTRPIHINDVVTDI